MRALGEAQLEAWLAEPVEAEPHLQTVLLIKVVLALMLGRSADGYLDAQRSAHLERMRELTGLNRSGDLLDGLLVGAKAVPRRVSGRDRPTP